MIAGLIRWSILNRFLVLIGTVFLVGAGIWSVSTTPLDALPDLSDTQVIVRTPFPGQAPQIVEDLVTYPLTTTMLSVPGAKTVRGYSRSSATRLSTSCSTTRPTPTGHGRGWSST